MEETLIKNPVTNYALDEIDDMDDGEPEPLFDEYGNPTPETLQACYEVENGLTEKMTLEEFFAELDEICGKKDSVATLSNEDYRGIKETNYLLSIPGMREKLLKGMAEPISECISEEDVGW